MPAYKYRVFQPDTPTAKFTTHYGGWVRPHYEWKQVGVFGTQEEAVQFVAMSLKAAGGQGCFAVQREEVQLVPDEAHPVDISEVRN